MRRALLGLVLLAGSAVAGEARADPRSHEAAPEGFVRLLGLPSGGAWRAGAEATIGWEPGPRFASGVPGLRVEEWEAFLSLDGGATWSVRLTPHLSADLRRFTVHLPPLASADARLMLRFGDERREVEVVASRGLRLEASARAPHWPVRRAWHAGEAVRSSGPGVVIWTSGDRSGMRLTRFEAEATAAGLAAARSGRPPFALRALRSPPRQDVVSPPTAHIAAARKTESARGSTPLRSAFSPLGPLQASCRLNS